MYSVIMKLDINLNRLMLDRGLYNYSKLMRRPTDYILVRKAVIGDSCLQGKVTHVVFPLENSQERILS